MIATLTRPAHSPSDEPFAQPADEQTIRRTAAALEEHGITVLRARDATEARELVIGLIPEGSSVHAGASKTLDVTGIAHEVESSGRFDAIRPRIRSMDRATQGHQMRRLSAAPDVMLGSVHAITETGALVAASMGGSQLGPYLSGAGKVILVAGSQKIVRDLDDALRRIHDHVLPLESERALHAYGVQSSVNKLAIINREVVPGRITLVLVDEAIGF
jgi:hypothetical protein